MSAAGHAMSDAWINGQFVDESAASVSIRDTGLLHAAGVFTTMRSYAGKVFRLGEHLQRLRNSCEALFIPLQYKEEQLVEAVGELLSRNQLEDARLRLTVTRGAASADPLVGSSLQPTAFLTAAPLEPYPAEFYTKGLTVILLDEQKLNPYDLQAGHKTLNYFSRLAALREANRRGAGEALWFNVHNYLQSGSISNVFVVKNGALFTPPTKLELRDKDVAAATAYPKSAVLPGVTRGAILDIAKSQSIAVKLQSIDVSQLLDADEVFLTNSIMQVMPVCRIERKAIGDEKPGPVTNKLSAAYAKASLDQTT
jgi:branched-chain amino acid aminotransferase